MGEAGGDLDCCVQWMGRGKRAVIGGFGAFKREIRMELHQRVARLNGFVRIDLDFVIPLRLGGRQQDRPSKKTKRNRKRGPQSHVQYLTAPKRNSALLHGKLE